MVVRENHIMITEFHIYLGVEVLKLAMDVVKDAAIILRDGPGLLLHFLDIYLCLMSEFFFRLVDDPFDIRRDSTRNVGGNPWRDVVSNAIRNVVGNPSRDIVCYAFRNVVGNPSRDIVGNAVRHVVGNPSRDIVGNAIRNVVGNPFGEFFELRFHDQEWRSSHRRTTMAIWQKLRTQIQARRALAHGLSAHCAVCSARSSRGTAGAGLRGLTATLAHCRHPVRDAGNHVSLAGLRGFTETRDSDLRPGPSRNRACNPSLSTWFRGR